MSAPPPGMTQDRWVRLLDVARQADDRVNRGAATGPNWWAAAPTRREDDER